MRKFLLELLIDQGIISHANESIECGNHRGIEANDLITFINGMNGNIKNQVRTRFMTATSGQDVRVLWGQLTSGYAKHLNKLVAV